MLPVSTVVARDCDRDGIGLSLPRAEVRIAVRFRPQAAGVLDVHAFGVRQSVHRKPVRRGQRVMIARLQLGASAAVLGVPASELTGQLVPLEDLWGAAATERLRAQLESASSNVERMQALSGAIAERAATRAEPGGSRRLAHAAALQLESRTVAEVARELGVSERHLRRVFHQTVGLSPKAFARLKRFGRAIDLAHAEAEPGWGGIAAAAGYYDQAHLISDFRALSGVTPRALLDELRAGPLLV